MCLGKFPKPPLLQKYKLQEFTLITTAIKNGNVPDYNRAMEQYQDFYITQGIYLVLAKLKMLTYRNLFKKMYNLSAIDCEVCFVLSPDVSF
jgi:transglutaminase/protease-like cytokinesis protein 3